MFNEHRKDDHRHCDLHVIGQKRRPVKESELREKDAEGSEYQETGDAQHVKEHNQDDSGGDDDDDDNEEI